MDHCGMEEEFPGDAVDDDGLLALGVVGKSLHPPWVLRQAQG